MDGAGGKDNSEAGFLVRPALYGTAFYVAWCTQVRANLNTMSVQVDGQPEPKAKRRKLTKGAASGAAGRKPGRAVAMVKQEQPPLEDEETEAPAPAK